jgi:hypothetical protein
MSDRYPLVQPTENAKAIVIELSRMNGDRHYVPVSYAIRLRDRLTQAINAAQAPMNQSPTGPASPANPDAAT